MSAAFSAAPLRAGAMTTTTSTARRLARGTTTTTACCSTTTTSSYAACALALRRPMMMGAMLPQPRLARRAAAPLPPARATDGGQGANNANNAADANAAPAKPRTSVYNTEFGYTRKDIFLLGFGLIALGYAMYYGLQAIGMDAGMAGNWVQLLIFLGICVGYVSTYVYRVATKQMTYVKQLEQYEEAVMRRRLEEMTEAEVAAMVTEADAERAAREARRAAAAPSGAEDKA